MSAEFKNKKVIETLSKNYETHCSLNNKPMEMDFDFKKVIDEALEACQSAEKRARQMDLAMNGTQIATGHFIF